MMSLSHIDSLLSCARRSFAAARAWELKNPGRRSFQYSHAQEMLLRVINENEVAMSKDTWDAIEGLMAGDAKDVHEAFKVLGGYAKVGRENARYHRQHSRRTR